MHRLFCCGSGLCRVQSGDRPRCASGPRLGAHDRRGPVLRPACRPKTLQAALNHRCFIRQGAELCRIFSVYLGNRAADSSEDIEIEKDSRFKNSGRPVHPFLLHDMGCNNRITIRVDGYFYIADIAVPIFPSPIDLTVSV